MAAQRALRARVTSRIVDDLMEDLAQKFPEAAASVASRIPEFEDNFERQRALGLVRPEHIAHWEEAAPAEARERLDLRLKLINLGREYQRLVLKKALLDNDTVDIEDPAIAAVDQEIHQVRQELLKF